MEIVTILIPEDNYCYLIVNGPCAVAVDPSDAGPVMALLKARDLSLKAVLVTHHHSDHTGGNRALKEATGCMVYASDARASGVDRIIKDEEPLDEIIEGLRVMQVPGHTRLSVAYYLHNENALFTGDTLFGAGCGRLFECTAETMFHSLEKLAALPPSTRVYFGHEYTLDNCRFAQTTEPQNKDITARLHETQELYKKEIALNSFDACAGTAHQPFPACRIS